MGKSSQMLPPKPLSIFQPRANMICTRYLYFYVSDFDQIVEFFLFIVRLASTADEHSKNAAHALAAIDEGLIHAHEKEGTIEELKFIRDQRLAEIETGGAAKQLSQYSVMNVRHFSDDFSRLFLDCRISLNSVNT